MPSIADPARSFTLSTLLSDYASWLLPPASSDGNVHLDHLELLARFITLTCLTPDPDQNIYSPSPLYDSLVDAPDKLAEERMRLVTNLGHARSLAREGGQYAGEGEEEGEGGREGEGGVGELREGRERAEERYESEMERWKGVEEGTVGGLGPGATVEIRNLKSKPEANGERGKVLRFQPGTPDVPGNLRYVVESKTVGTFALKSSNLTVTSPCPTSHLTPDSSITKGARAALTTMDEVLKGYRVRGELGEADKKTLRRCYCFRGRMR